MKKFDYIAFFDLDDTLLTTFSGGKFYKFMFENKKISIFYMLRLLPMPILHKLGLLNLEKTSIKLANSFKDKHMDELVSLTYKWFHLDGKNYLRKSMIDEIEKHKRNNGKTVMLSASPKTICYPIYKYLKLDDYICTGLEVINGIFTGKITQYCYGETKAEMAEDYCKIKNYDLSKSFFYTDSISDLPLLEKVENPICVAPDKELTEIAQEKNWVIINS